MATRREQDRLDVASYMPSNTKHVVTEGRDIWIFKKQTELCIEFEIAVYYDPDERGYCAQLVSPEIESRWKSPHIGHLFDDGVICFGGESSRTRKTIREAFAKSCLWAEGMAIMIMSRAQGVPCQFMLSNNNSEQEAQE